MKILIRGQTGVEQGLVRGRFRVDQGSSWGWSGVDLGSIRGRVGVDQGSIWGQPGGNFTCFSDLRGSLYDIFILHLFELRNAFLPVVAL